MTASNVTAPASIVLVHGAFVDGSGWEDVYKLLRKEGYPVSVVQEATASLIEDVATTRRVLDTTTSPTVLVGHSYGGVVITEAGNHPTVAGLVYINAFAPDAGESVATLIKDPPPGSPVAPLVPAGEGFLGLDKSKFHHSFAADVSADKAAFMADSQLPWGVAAVEGRITTPAWRSRPSWYLVASEDRMIPPRAQRLMAERAGSTVVEAAASHASFVSQPRAVVDLILKAAKSVGSAKKQRSDGRAG
jgi:pimeloyl-ACP methyl ester carboxylesterase